MHELGIAEGILSVVLDAAGEEPVRRVSVTVGALHAIVPDSLQMSFQLVAEDTCAAAAALEIDEVAAEERCRRCGARTPFSGTVPCRGCGASEMDIVAGQELRVDRIELASGRVVTQGAVVEEGGATHEHPHADHGAGPPPHFGHVETE